MEQKIIYLDNAASSFPKPECVYAAVNTAMRGEYGNPGRAGHKPALSAQRVIDEARLLCARLFHAALPENIVFTGNTTAALNIAIKGILEPGDHVIASALEHNSVARPLHHLQKTGIEVTKLPADIINGITINSIKEALRPNTRLLVCNHISNVTGTVNNIAAIGTFCRENNIIFLTDAAQSAGARDINVQEMCIDMLAFPGHKSLFGPQGTGGLYIRPGLELKTIMQGGTGSASEELSQPESMPAKFESGTLNTPGLAGLAAGIGFILDTGIATIEKRESLLVNMLIEGIQKMNNISLIGPGMGCSRGNVVSIRIENKDPANIALMLDASFSVAVRSGLHCASDAHRSIGTLDGGTLRISPNCCNSEDDIAACLDALEYCANN